MSQAALLDRTDTMVELAQSHQSFHLGSAKLTATLFGKKFGEQDDVDWSLRTMGQDTPHALECAQRIGTIARELKAGRLYAPSIPDSFNAKMLGMSDFMAPGSAVRTGFHMLSRSLKNLGEGLLLSAGEAALLTPAGCGTAVIEFRGRVAVLHFGRWSLFDRGLLTGGPLSSGRAHESIVFAALEYLGVCSEQDARDVHVRVFWCIDGDRFLHPLTDSHYADGNHLLLKRMAEQWRVRVQFVGTAFQLHLVDVLRKQLFARGVLEMNVNITTSRLPDKGVWHDGRVGKPRNAVFVIRHK